jgi:tRNA(Ile)-lysidine synthase
MLQAFIENIKKQKLVDPSSKILLTVSGGIDSVVLAALFHEAALNFGIAHCNFQLRGKESEQDEDFVEKLAEKYNVPFHSVAFETDDFAKENKLSIQVAARTLRYQWFEKIRKQFKYDFIATAHHKDDSIETFLINIIRGTGIAGMHGILPKQNNIIRPLLFANKKEITAFAKELKLKFREDSSNASDKYLRNKIRNKIIPSLKELNPSIDETIANSIQHLSEVEIIFRKEIEKKRKELVSVNRESISISIKKIKKLNPASIYLFEFLKPFNFNSSSVIEILNSLDAESGKQFFSESHRLIKDRETLIITEIKKRSVTEEKLKQIKVKKDQKKISLNGASLHFQTFPKTRNYKILVQPETASLDFEKLQFPLLIRKWQKGDSFQPIGMKGKKKLSDFFIDSKLSLIEKENVNVLISGNEIAWVIGYRISEHFKITNNTSKIYFAELH